MAISANALFHFTRSLDNLLSILENGFYPRYALEHQTFGHASIPDRHIAIPMVSFCDIPLSQVKSHVRHYGNYALGLTKDWARKNGISPVLYSLPESLTLRTVVSMLLEDLPSLNQAQQFSSLSLPQRHRIFFSFFVKRYQGKLYRKNKYSKKTVRFYDEREWRYLPPIKVLSEYGVNSFLSRETFDRPLKRTSENFKISQHTKLTFRPNDIKYVIVKSESEILQARDAILAMKSLGIAKNQVRLLASRILSMKHILEDF